MKGIVLAAGRGTRLQPMTKAVSKLLLPIYDRPMIDYPLSTLHRLGIRTAMIVISPEHACQVKDYLGNQYHDMSLTYGIQEQPLGSADALKVAKEYAGDSNIAVILGDQYFNELPNISRFSKGAFCYAQEVPNASRFGTITTDLTGNVSSITEKPPGNNPGLALVGFYLFDSQIWNRLDRIQQSSRGEYELTDALRFYASVGELQARTMRGFWTDAGTPESLYVASTMARQHQKERTNHTAGQYV